MILTPLQNLPKNVGDLVKIVVAKGFQKLPKVQKSPNLVTLTYSHSSMLMILDQVTDGSLKHVDQCSRHQ